jgi:hypothetical protein
MVGAIQMGYLLFVEYTFSSTNIYSYGKWLTVCRN